MNAPLPEVWLRGPVPGIDPHLQPVAHALLAVLEDVERAALPLGPEEIWATPGGAASIGFHLRHLAGATDRLFTYARGEQLSEHQRAVLASERTPGDPPMTATELVGGVRRVVESALEQLRRVPPDRLLAPREVGRQRLPSTVLGLLFHAAEHAQRHAGQIATTARIVSSMKPTG
ncbi:MAG: DinB family protein [Gemmatimonadota bacterium]